MKDKHLSNTDASGAKKNVSDLKIWGDGDMFKLLCKASSQEEGWMKSTKAMEITGVGCVVQVTTQQRVGAAEFEVKSWAANAKRKEGEDEISVGSSKYVIAEAVTFVPNVRIEEQRDPDTQEVISRRLVAL